MPSHKSKGANLDEFARMALKANILNEFPNLKGTFEDEIDFIINEYSKDKNYIKRISDKAKVVESVIKDTEDHKAEFKAIKPDDPEYKRIMDALDKAKREHEERIEKGYAEEQQQKLSKDSNIDNVQS